MAKVRLWIVRALRGLTGLSLGLMFAVVLASSISRYLFDSPFVWSEEFAKFAMIYGVMFGASLAYLENTQISITLFAQLLAHRWEQRLSILVDVACIVFGLGFAVSGVVFAARRGGIEASGLGMPMVYAQSAIALGGALFALVGLLKLVDRRTNAKANRPQ